MELYCKKNESHSNCHTYSDSKLKSLTPYSDLRVDFQTPIPTAIAVIASNS